MTEEERWEKHYQEGHTPWDTGQPSSELMRVVATEGIQPGTCIELGCGTGVNAVWLAQQGFDVTAIDFSTLALDRARKHAADAGVAVRFLEGDVLDPPAAIGGPYDFVFDRGCYHVVRRIDVSRYLRTLQQITRPGSRGLILTGNAREPHDPGPPLVSEEEIRTEIGGAFEIVDLREFRFDQVEEGGVRFLGWSCSVRRTD